MRDMWKPVSHIFDKENNLFDVVTADVHKSVYMQVLRMDIEINGVVRSTTQVVLTDEYDG